MAQHSPQFLKIVNDARKRIKETTVADVKRRMDAGEKFLLVDVRGKRVRQRPPARRRTHEQRRDRARYRAARARSKNEAHSLLRGRISLRACRGKFAEDGLYECGIDGRRLARLERRRSAHHQALSRGGGGKSWLGRKDSNLHHPH